MSRLTDKIEKARFDLEEAQDRLDCLERKQLKANFKKRRKNHRKKYANDPAYRLMWKQAQIMFNTFLPDEPGQATETFLGLDAQLRHSDELT